MPVYAGGHDSQAASGYKQQLTVDGRFHWGRAVHNRSCNSSNQPVFCSRADTVHRTDGMAGDLDGTVGGRMDVDGDACIGRARAAASSHGRYNTGCGDMFLVTTRDSRCVKGSCDC